MLSENAKQTVASAKRIYAEQLRSKLESSDLGKYVCIEPKSGDCFVGETFDAAVNQAIDAHPDCLTHTLRIGHDAAIHMGVLAQ
ncbi:MAG: hypothetical protein AAGD11_00355 [Planctomycetota bacterium]